MEEGYIMLSRRFFLHTLWMEERAYSRAEAWVDLIRTAAFRDTKRVIQGNLIQVPRGGIVASVRFLSGRWKWSTTKTCKFLDVLRLEGMIKTEKRQGQTVLLLCKFEEYNTEKRQESNGEKTPERQRKDKVEEGKEGEERESPRGDSISRPAEPRSGAAFAKSLHEAYCRLTENKTGLSYQREMRWTQFIQRGFTEDDLALVVRWLQTQIARGEGGFSKQSLQFGTLMQDLDRFEDKLCTARTCKLPGVAKQAPPRPPPDGWEDYLRKTYKGCKVTAWEALTSDLKRECREGCRHAQGADTQPNGQPSDTASETSP
jgi:hypothetical protein